MKKSTLIVSALCIMATGLAISNPVKAQDRKQQMAEMIKNSTPEDRAKMQTQMMKTKLNLDSLTGLKVYDINLKAAQKMEPVLKGDSGKLAMFRQMKSIDADKDKEFKAVLSPAQYKAYEAAKEEMKEKMKEKMQERKAAKG
jgi:excinuclease UvrABC ATPase subunit